MAKIEIYCSGCGSKLMELGALLFSPPDQHYPRLQCDVTKYHICTNCWQILINGWLFRQIPTPQIKKS